MINLRFGFFAAAIGMALLGSPAAAQTAATSPDPMMMHVDCSKASDMMTPTGDMHAMPAMSGNVDKDFVAMAMMHQHAMMTLMQVEVQCGKDPQLKAAAAKQMHESLTLLEMLQTQGQRF